MLRPEQLQRRDGEHVLEVSDEEASQGLTGLPKAKKKCVRVSCNEPASTSNGLCIYCFIAGKNPLY